MKRWAFMVPFVFLVCALAAGICGAAPAEELERRIRELEKAIGESVKSGRPWPNTLCDTLDDCRGQMVVSDRETGHIF